MCLQRVGWDSAHCNVSGGWPDFRTLDVLSVNHISIWIGTIILLPGSRKTISLFYSPPLRLEFAILHFMTNFLPILHLSDFRKAPCTRADVLRGRGATSRPGPFFVMNHPETFRRGLENAGSTIPVVNAGQVTREPGSTKMLFVQQEKKASDQAQFLLSFP